MKRLASEGDIADLVKRIGTLTPDSSRKWGRMSCGQMVCHLSDAFRGLLGDLPLAPRSTWLKRTVLKWIGLSTPIPWPRGFRTHPSIDQVEGAGTSLGPFAQDVAALVELMRRFIAQDSNDRRPHPGFGPLSAREWGRWGWAHVDHHLRQFGA